MCWGAKWCAALLRSVGWRCLWCWRRALLSTFLTNDVALFIVVPLTITLKRLCEIPVNRLIIFEALAVNAGSLLTPIGNPQNILIWGRSGLSFAGFIAQMAPLAGAMMLTLLLFVLVLFSLERHCNTIRGCKLRSGNRGWCGVVWGCISSF
ncbi:transporter [Escherichia coli]|uniref:Transporter n=1 Tax=Escherichia coli TaxID=562 RepID=A0A377DKP8_ECOLX|nr:transporter [Escherichia coli]